MSRPEITLFLLSLFAVTAGWHIRKLRDRVKVLEIQMADRVRELEIRLNWVEYKTGVK